MKDILINLGIEPVLCGAYHGEWIDTDGDFLESGSPIDDQPIAKVKQASETNLEAVITRASRAFQKWRVVPAPRRGDLVRQIGLALRRHKADLGALVSMEMGKIRAEGEGEVQEMIDMTDFAAGLSRQLYGHTMHSERPFHRMYEQYHPLGVVGVISAFNFPVAVWSWNAMIALVCGDAVVWKPSSQTPLTAIACMKIADGVLKENDAPDGILGLVIGPGETIGRGLVSDSRIPLVSFTGSTERGREIGTIVGKRLGRTILELGGNNAVIVSDKADQDMAVSTILFGAVGTAGQRCTSTRRVIIHQKIYKTFVERLVHAYKQIKIGNPLDEGILMGPLVNKSAVRTMKDALKQIENEGGKIVYGGDILKKMPAPNYVTPCLVECDHELPIIMKETFAPILYLLKYSTIEEAVQLNNAVPQGLSSSIFTLDMKEAEYFLSHLGSDCGIANVNISTSGAEIGGAFGGEKETGGGREAGSDAWKQYMRRQTNTINWSGDLPLAQGIRFDVDK